MSKRNKITVSVISGIIVLGIFLTVIFTGDKPPVKNDKTASNTTTSNSINVDIPSEASSKANTDAIKADIGGETSLGNTASPSENKKAESGASQVKTSPPKQSSNTASGITIGNQTSSTDNSETDAFIKNLEIQGCPYCGKHDCISFYAKDEWGNPCYTPSKCPQYDIHKDPVYYCQECCKKTGDGTNGTCVQFVNDCYCPKCGKWVPARTCHTCP